MPLTATLVFTVLGPLFLLLGAASVLRARRLAPQSRTWLIIGVIFSAVAAWLHWSQPLVALLVFTGPYG
jgi:uncharacterized membrane protein HdeD (DUF308 family)